MIGCCMWSAVLRRYHQPAKKMFQRHVSLLSPVLGIKKRRLFAAVHIVLH